MINSASIISILPRLLQGASVSLAIALCSATLGFTAGTLLGIAQTGKNRWVSRLVTLYATIIRGTPMLLQIMFFYLMLPDALLAAIIAIGINSSSYVSQIVRSGICSVPSGQIEAAKTLGINQFDRIRYIVLPQAIRTVIPSLGNELITLIKDTSLASTIGVLELFQQGEIIKSQTYNAFPVYISVGLVYLAMTTVLSIIVHTLEKRLNSHARN